MSKSDSQYSCGTCTMMMYYFDTLEVQAFFLTFPGKGTLIWHTGNGMCGYNLVGTQPIKLPWLPFTITWEKLHLYLLFS